MTTPNKIRISCKGIRPCYRILMPILKRPPGNLKGSVVDSVVSVTRITLDQIQTNPNNPRHDFDEAALNELAASIKMHDIIQPLTVSKLASGKYQLIAGNAVTGLQNRRVKRCSGMCARLTMQKCWNWPCWRTCSVKILMQ